jgi:hypothetical protein
MHKECVEKRELEGPKSRCEDAIKMVDEEIRYMGHTELNCLFVIQIMKLRIPTLFLFPLSLSALCPPLLITA